MEKEVFISTEQVEVGLRSEFWRELTKPVFETLPFPEDNDRPLEGSVRSRPLGALLIGGSTFNRQRYNRDRHIILQGGLDNYMVQFVTSGTLRGDFGGSDVSAGPGDICIQDLTQTLQSEVEAGSRMIVVVPRKELEKTFGARNLHGVVLRAGLPVTQLITAYVRGLHAISGKLTDMQTSAVQESVIALVSSALRGEEPDEVADYSPLAAALRQRILEFIAKNINLPELSPYLIARRFNVSRSHLYRAFAMDGGVAKVLRDMRLDAAFVELSHANGSSRPIADIAYSLGFANGNQFLRSFRARFGMTPSEAREEKTSSPSGRRRASDLHAHFVNLHGRAFRP